MPTAPPPTKTAIVIELDQLRDLMREFAVEQEPDADARVGLDWTFELFLQWVRKRQERGSGGENELKLPASTA